MKKLQTTLLACLLILSSIVFAGPGIEFETTELDYGVIEQGSDGKREFTFTNTGDEPLIITKCQKTCGCTIPACPEEAIAPGESSTIVVSYDTKRPGSFAKTVIITSNASTQPVRLKITGEVKPKG